MKIETKFSIGDTAFFMNENRVQIGEITRIEVTINSQRTSTVYYATDWNLCPHKRYRNEIFPSKEELLKSL